MSNTVFVAILIVAVTMVVQTLFQNTQLRREREALDTQFVNQRPLHEQAQQLRSQLESIAGETAILAAKGNQNAVQIRDYLQQQGVTIRPPQP